MVALTEALVTRREWLCTPGNVPSCQKCQEAEQIQLLKHNGVPALWRCRVCGAPFHFEPEGKDPSGFFELVSRIPILDT